MVWAATPAGVVLDAERWTPADRQRIAALVGLSETAFMTPPSPCELVVDLTRDGDALTGVRVGGRAHLTGRLEIAW